MAVIVAKEVGMSPEDIKRIRSILGWSQERFAREIGVSFCTVNRWERGKTTPSPMGLNALKALEGRCSQSERRRFLRSPVRCPVTVDIPGVRVPGAHQEYTLTGLAEDLSAGGLRFSYAGGSGSPTLRAGDSLTFRLLLGDGRWVDVPSVVRWTADAAGRARAGLMYAQGISGEAAALIEAALSE